MKICISRKRGNENCEATQNLLSSSVIRDFSFSKWYRFVFIDTARVLSLLRDVAVFPLFDVCMCVQDGL